jgi:adenylylsulfate kinase
MKVNKKRSLVKALTWRVIALGTTFVSIYIITGKLQFALQGTVLTNTINFILYYVHERGWNKIQWGRESKNY